MIFLHYESCGIGQMMGEIYSINFQFIQIISPQNPDAARNKGTVYPDSLAEKSKICFLWRSK